MKVRYLIKDVVLGEFVEVDKAAYVAVERRAGFRNTLGKPDEPATASFSNGTLEGRTEHVAG